jgi:hypothetical protein
MSTPNVPGDDLVQHYLMQACELRACAAGTDDPDEQRVLSNAANAYEELARWSPKLRPRSKSQAGK